MGWCCFHVFFYSPVFVWCFLINSSSSFYSADSVINKKELISEKGILNIKNQQWFDLQEQYVE